MNYQEKKEQNSMNNIIPSIMKPGKLTMRKDMAMEKLTFWILKRDGTT